MQTLRKIRSFLTHQWRTLITLQDSTDNVLNGFTLGVFIGFLPIMGVQIMLVLAISLVARFNVIAATIAVFITNPLTAIPIYLFNTQVGVWVLGSKISRQDFLNLRNVQSADEFFTIVMNLGYAVLWPLCLGSLIVALVCSLLTYFGMKPILKKYHNWKKEEHAGNYTADH